MNKLLLIFVMLFMSVSFASAVNVGVVIEFPDSTVYKECIGISENSDGYDLLEKTNLDIEWTEYIGWGHFICGIDGIGGTVTGGTCVPDEGYWLISLDTGNGWQSSPVGVDAPGGCWNRDFSSFTGHYCTQQGDIFGLVIGDWGDTPNVHYSFEDVCETKLEFKDVKIYVDDDKSSADEDGGKIKDVMPGSIIEMEVEVENLFTDQEDIEINDIEVEAVIEDIDDGDDIDEDADEFDLDPEEDDSVDLVFKIPYDVDDKDYDMILTAEGIDSNGVRHKVEVKYEVQIEKEDEDVMIRTLELNPPFVECGGKTSLEAKIINTGQEDLEVSVHISNSQLDLFETKNFELDENEDRSLEFDIDTFGAENGVYPIKVILDFGYDTKTESLDLEIFGCKEETKQADVDVAPPEGMTVITGFASFEPEEEDFFESQAWQVLVLIVAILGIIVGLLLIFSIK